MGLIETEGLILKTYNLAEADRIVILLTQNEGLVRGVAKGAKRLKSRFGGGLEPFSIINITYFQKEERELVSISQIELVKSFFAVASVPNFFQKFAYLGDLLLEFAPPHDPDERLYRMAKICLETAADNPEFLDYIALYFEIWILRFGGYLPDWNRCEKCKKEFGGTLTAELQINFQLLCRECRVSRSHKPISPEQRQLLGNAQKFSPQKFVELAKDQMTSVGEVSHILRRLISSILGRESVGEKTLTAHY